MSALECGSRRWLCGVGAGVGSDVGAGVRSLVLEAGVGAAGVGALVLEPGVRAAVGGGRALMYYRRIGYANRKTKSNS